MTPTNFNELNELNASVGGKQSRSRVEFDFRQAPSYLSDDDSSLIQWQITTEELLHRELFHHSRESSSAQRPARQIGAGDIPTIPANRPGITPPPVPNFNFDIKTSLINLVENSIFHGMKDEDPFEALGKV
ncbi:unnamed protein product [Microthlaspi erraticum]|uniref:Uncharacterized protein n=1 Tax=Microthlaspi erraticum TaxID=1685480 RepID=A0A6D2HXW0_9BRAS|nr:unnamed protein product [Microthlaspi erraticum]